MLRLQRQESETWLDAALRRAAPYGLEAEVRAVYEGCRAMGLGESESAFNACLEWDVLEFIDDSPEVRPTVGLPPSVKGGSDAQ